MVAEDRVAGDYVLDLEQLLGEKQTRRHDNIFWECIGSCSLWVMTLVWSALMP